MRWSFISRIYAVLLTTVTFVIGSSLVFMNETYGLGFYAIAFLVYGAPPICLIGLPFSIVVDTLLARLPLNNKWMMRAIRILAYGVAGSAGTLLYFVILASGEWQSFDTMEMMPFLLLGIFAALLFLLFYSLLQLAFRKIEARNRQAE